MRKNIGQCRGKLRGLGARTILAAVFLVALGGESAFGAAYSDIWVVSYGGSNVVVKACGVTDESYSGYNHEFSISSTIYSPNGRTASGYANNGGCTYSGSYECGQANVSMPAADASGEFEEGEFFVDTVHQTFCPYRNMELADMFTSAFQTVALKKSAYRLIDESNVGGSKGFGTCGFGRTCFGACAEGAFLADKLFPGPCSQFVQCKTLWAGGVCFHDTRVCLGIPQAGVCDP